MKLQRTLGLIGALTCMSMQLVAAATPNTGPIKTDRYQASFVRLGAANLNGLLYEPSKPGPNARIALVYAYPRAAFDPAPAEELASRGYRVLLVKHYLGARRGVIELPSDGVLGASRGINYVRALPGVERVVLMGWGTGARMVAFYANVAEHGPAACQSPEAFYPCKNQEVANLAKPDGVVMFDPGFGALTLASNVDPAYDGISADAWNRSQSDLDMFAAANGYDANTGSANYSAAFRKKYFAAQSARNNAVIDQAIARVKLLDQGKGEFTDDETFLIPGAVNTRSAASLHRTDLSILSRTKRPHILLKADGSKPEVIVQSIRPATGQQNAQAIDACCTEGNYTVRQFLANDAVRTTKDFALTENDVLGVDWKTSNTSTPANAAGITAPTLVLTMTCFQFVVPSEIVYDQLAAKDKTYAAVEGAEHTFTPCKPEYGDTKQRAFDFVASWLSKPGRF